MIPKEILQKKADVSKQRIILPLWFVNKNGYYYTMKVYEDKIILIPDKKKNKEEIWKENLKF